MYKYAVTTSRNGRGVYVNLITSSAGFHINRQPYLLGLLKEALESVNLSGPAVAIEQDMGRIIGNTDIVETSEKDSVFYALPHKRKVFSRYVKNRSLTPSSSLSIVLEQDADGNYEVSDTWVGPCSPPFPGDEKANAKSKAYWETHALVIDAQVIQTKSITKECPY